MVLPNARERGFGAIRLFQNKLHYFFYNSKSKGTLRYIQEVINKILKRFYIYDIGLYKIFAKHEEI